MDTELPRIRLSTFYDHSTHASCRISDESIEFGTPTEQWSFAISFPTIIESLGGDGFTAPILIRVNAAVSRGAIGVGFISLSLNKYVTSEPQLAAGHDSDHIDILLDTFLSEPVLMIRNVAANGPSAGTINSIEVITVNTDRCKHVLIHQMGKVGSVSIENSLRLADSKLPITRLHMLCNESLAELSSLQSLKPNDVTYADSLNRQIEEALDFAHAHKQRRQAQTRICVLSAYRDPMSFFLSSLFQNIQKLLPDIGLTADTLDDDCERIASMIDQSVTRLLEGKTHADFASQFIAYLLNLPLTWFDREFLAFHGIDIYQQNPDKYGLFVFESDTTKYVVYRFESLTNEFENIVRSIGLPHAIPCHKNAAADKPCALTYSTFRQRFKPSEELALYYFGSRYYQFFYPNTIPRYLARDAA